MIITYLPRVEKVSHNALIDLGALFVSINYSQRGIKYVKRWEERCLCVKCKTDYETAGYIVKFIYEIKIKYPCDKCGRMGWTYKIKRNN